MKTHSMFDHMTKSLYDPNNLHLFSFDFSSSVFRLGCKMKGVMQDCSSELVLSSAACKRCLALLCRSESETMNVKAENKQTVSL